MRNSRFGILIAIILLSLATILAVFGPILIKKKITEVTTGVKKDQFILAKGVVESEEEIEVSSQVSGIITEIKVDEGDTVKKGQPLVMLDNKKILVKIRQAKAILREAKAHLKELKAGYRVSDVFEMNESRCDLQNLLKEALNEEIEKAKAKIESAFSELEYYKILLKDYTVSSPIDGTVAERFKDANETVGLNMPILKLISPDKLRIRAELEETDVGKVREGQSVEVHTDAYKDRIYRGKVYKIIPFVKRGPEISTQDMFISLDDFSGLETGMSVTVKFMALKNRSLKTESRNGIGYPSVVVQVGAFRIKENAERLKNYLLGKVRYRVVEICQDGRFYKVQITGLKDEEEALNVMKNLGIKKYFLIK
ncbi:MAG: efflux RND transporter periplasmic adaptor subunit [Nitrospirota bacterium]